MRVSIWQQWSGNHSGSFRVVGEFAAPEAAARAVDIIHRLQPAISAGWPSLEEQQQGQKPPTERIEAVLQEYGLPRDRYTHICDYHGQWAILIGHTVSAWDRLLLVANDDDAAPYWDDAYRALITALGGYAAVQSEYEGSYYGLIHIHLSCDAPDAATAITLYEALDAALTYFEQPYYRHRPPRSLPWAREDADLDAMDARGTIARDDRRLSLDLQFFAVDSGLPALVEYLRSHGCTRITYTSEDIRFSDPSAGRDIFQYGAQSAHLDNSRVIGVFPTVEQAKTVAEALRLPAEQRNKNHRVARDNTAFVETWDRLVMCADWNEWYDRSAAYDELRNRGAHVVVEREAWGVPVAIARTTLTCVAPDTASAAMLHESIGRYLTLADDERARQAPPWGDHLRMGADGSIQRQDHELMFELEFFLITAGLPVLVAYLTARGCARIAYSVMQVDKGSEEHGST